MGRVWKDDRDGGMSAVRILSQAKGRDRLSLESEQREATSKRLDLEGVRLEAQADFN